MGLDDFTSGSTSSSKDQEENTNSAEKQTSSSAHTGTTLIQGDKPKVKSKYKSDPDAYDQEYLKECYRCGNKSVLLPFLSDLGNVWFCSNTECINSVAHHCNETASSKALADKVDVQSVHDRMNEITETDPREMGLDDFSSDDSSSSTDSSSSSSNDEQDDEDDDLDIDEIASQLNAGDSSSSTVDDDDISTDSSMDFYGTGDVDVGTQPMERKGAMSNHSTAELMQHTEGSIERSDDDIKFHSPTFPIISIEDQYSQGDHYKLQHTDDKPRASWHNRVVTCISSVETALGEMNKEVVMYAFGSPSKKQVMDKVHEMLGDDIDGETTVYINFFGDTMFMRDMAQANIEYREGDKLNIDKIGTHVLNKNMLRVGLDEPSPPDGG